MNKSTSFAYKIIEFLVRLFYHKMEVCGQENLPDGPYIAAGNHSQMNGPIACELYFPGRHYIWCISQMMDRRLVPAYAYKDFWSLKPKYIRWFYRILSYLIAPLSECVFTNADTIPVYKDKRVFETIDLSVRHLEEGAGVIIFPEDYAEHNNIVHTFQHGFVSVAKRYYAKTGERIPFVPIYVCPALKKLVIGKPVYYDPDHPAREEQERICNELMDAISELAYALPKHRVVPYPNISRKEYPENTRTGQKL
ncbi:MAG: 1-acyl-sn-glycerol-3-phosphate acyltransferase [Lachnospiraceae bacterium]|nr:1-acyl-sn-glycerol-3-phosphate acyltransferase [Lachnospiraceae bacterium]